MSQHVVWEDYSPESGWAFAEEMTGLTAEQQRRLREGGHPVRPRRPITVSRLSEGRLGEVVGTVWMGRLVAPSLRAVIAEAAGQRARFLPTESPREEMFLLNLLDVVDCLDRATSEVETVPGHPNVVRAVHRLRLTDLSAGSPPMFHVTDLPGLIIVTSSLRSEMERRCQAPGQFVAVGDYQRGLV